MKLTKLQQLLAGIGIIGLVALLTIFLFLKGDRQRIRAAERNIADLEQDINIARQIEQTAAVLQEEMSNLNDQLERLKKILPVEVNEPLFVADIKRFANENGIEIMELSRNNQVQDDVIIEIPYSFETLGHYHDYGRFFARLTNYQRIVNIKALHIVLPGSNKNNLVEGEYSVQGSFVISVYLYREPSKEELRKKFSDKKKAMSKRR